MPFTKHISYNASKTDQPEGSRFLSLFATFEAIFESRGTFAVGHAEIPCWSQWAKLCEDVHTRPTAGKFSITKKTLSILQKKCAEWKAEREPRFRITAKVRCITLVGSLGDERTISAIPPEGWTEGGLTACGIPNFSCNVEFTIYPILYTTLGVGRTVHRHRLCYPQIDQSITKGEKELTIITMSSYSAQNMLVQRYKILVGELCITLQNDSSFRLFFKWTGWTTTPVGKKHPMSSQNCILR